MIEANNIADNNKRIAKNTVYLYIRMAVVMVVSLYTSRKVLEMLGVSDYGVYDVMGGVIGMLGYANTLLAGGISRFLTIGLGEGDMKKLTSLFSTTLSMSLLSAIVVALLGETIGLWFVNTHLNIPEGRMDAAVWVYQCALLSSCLTIIQSPFTASVISHEKMSIYAYMSVFDCAIKLFIVYLLAISGYDKLKTYGTLLLLSNLLNVIIYRFYCLHNFKECSNRLGFSVDTFKSILSYNSWNMIGGFAGILTNYGVNILVNIFFGPVVNAARGVATQVTSIVRNLYSNFQMAANPQIYKYYAGQKLSEMYSLVINTSRYCSYLLLCVIIPIMVNIDGLLGVWLHEVPPFTSGFVQLSLIYVLVCSLDAPVGISIHAVGRMKAPNLSTALINLCVFPFSWLFFKLGGQPFWGYIFMIVSILLCLAVDLYIVKRYISFPIMQFINKSLLPVLLLGIGGYLMAFIVKQVFHNEDIISILFSSMLSALLITALVFFVGLPKRMRMMVLGKINFRKK